MSQTQSTRYPSDTVLIKCLDNVWQDEPMINQHCGNIYLFSQQVVAMTHEHTSVQLSSVLFVALLPTVDNQHSCGNQRNLTRLNVSMDLHFQILSQPQLCHITGIVEATYLHFKHVKTCKRIKSNQHFSISEPFCIAKQIALNVYYSSIQLPLFIYPLQLYFGMNL